MDIRQLSVLLFFGLWLLASILVYLPALNRFIRKGDIFALVPQWNFFAPRPAQHDFLLLYRDQLKDGQITEWAQLSNISRRSGWSIFWNPAKRNNKALFDAVTDLARHMKASTKGLELSVPYLTILMRVSGMPHFGPAILTQFLLMRSGGARTPEEHEVLFLSNFHAL